MNIWVAFGALIVGVIVWFFLVKRLSTRSWERHGSSVHARHPRGDVGEVGVPPARIALWGFLAVITSLFGLFISAYFIRMGHGHEAVHGIARGGVDRGAPEHRAVHGVLALSASGVAGDVRLVVVYLTQRISRMAQDASIAGQPAAVEGLGGVAADWSGDKQAFPVPWGKVMMWIFLLSDTFIFSCFLTSYMNVRMSTTASWPDPSKVFELEIGGHPVPLLLIAIMTMVLITSSGTMALAVDYGYRRHRAQTSLLMCAP